MPTEILIRVVALCVLLASVETLHGIARTTWLVPRVGKARALQIGALTGSILAFIVCWVQVPGMGLTSPQAHIALGRLLLRKPWHKIRDDFNPATGNYLLYGLVALGISPLIAWLGH
ncbi:hypothetical protein [Aquabacterium sp.]|uniref:hypothetical protein n=1 Tax=Aquabacterium sp. TaxID=1872578 RepID=UPI0035B0D8B6